jgi:hypothetical protein
MVPCDYLAKDGSRRTFDLDAVFDLVSGYSARHKEWTALLIYVPAIQAFVELRSSPPDVRGNSADEAEEVDEPYIRETFGLSQTQLSSIQANPKGWRFVDQRKRSSA